MSKGVLYITWPGEARTEAALQRSIESLKKVHPELPYHVERLPEGSTLLDKPKMYDLSPFEETLFLDADTVVLERLDYGFKKARQFGIAICVCECPYARRFEGLKYRGDIVEYNTGAVWFCKYTIGQRFDGLVTEDVFTRWKLQSAILDSRLTFMSDAGEKMLMPSNDQASFALAIDRLDFNPFVLPLNWNFRPIWQHTAFGPIKIWHDYKDVPEAVLKWNADQSKPDAVIQCGRLA
jgi:hypothetical protein